MLSARMHDAMKKVPSLDGAFLYAEMVIVMKVGFVYNKSSK